MNALEDTGGTTKLDTEVKKPSQHRWARFIGYIKRKSDERHAKKQEESAADRAARRTAAATIWMAIFTLVLTAVSGGTLWILKNQLREMHEGGIDTHALADATGKMRDAAEKSAQASRDFADTADDINVEIGDAVKKLEAQAKAIEANRKSSELASTKALDATIDNFHQEQRAWVGVENSVLEKFKVGLPVIVKVRVMNRGKTPAVDVMAGGTGGRIVSNDHTPAQVADILKEEFAKIQLHPEATISPQSGEEFIGTEAVTLDTSRFSVVSSGVSTWYMVGKVTYKDVFHRDQWVTYCLKMVFVDRNPALANCETDNDMSH